MLEHEINAPELLHIARSGLTGSAGRPTRIAVMGAGIAGLCAALELSAAGHEVVVLEGQNRVGGRIRTLRGAFSDGVYAEAGAMRIPARHLLVLAYVERFGLQLRPFRSHNPQGWAFFHHQRRRLAQAMDDHEAYGFDLTDREREIPFDTLWAETLKPSLDTLSKGATEEWEALQERLQAISLRDYLRELGWSEGATEKYGLFAGFETLLHASACEFIREFAADLRAATYAIAGGMDQLPQRMARVLGDVIRYGHVITALDQNEEGVRIHVKTPGGPTVIEADYAICTLPLAVLRHVEIRPSFSRGKQRAIRNIHYEAATKIFFECNRRFWEQDDGIFGGASVTDLAIRNLYYPEHNRDLGRGALLASYSHGQDALRWGALPHHERLTQALENLAEVHPQVLRHVEGGQSVVWNQDEFAGGAYAFFQPGQESQLHEHILAREGRYFFAGEHASLQHRWLQGAVESALRVAREIHELTRSLPQTTLSQSASGSDSVVLDREDATLDHFGTDFGRIIHRRPSAVVRPTTTEDVVRALKVAQERDLEVVARGVGHSAGGQAQTEGGLVIDMTSLCQIHRVDPAGGTFEADAGATWESLLEALLPLGLAPPIVTDWHQLTLGGTVSAGGVGAQTFARGVQADLVEALEVVTPRGEVVNCSADQNEALFDAARAGLGQFGVITRVTMRVEAAPESLTLDHLVFDDLADFLSAVRLLCDTPGVDGLLAHAIPNQVDWIGRSTGRTIDASAHRSAANWVYDLEVLRYHRGGGAGPLPRTPHVESWSSSREWRFADFTRRVPPIIERDVEAGVAPHPELALFVPDAEAESFMSGVMDALPVEDMGGGPVLIIPLRTEKIDAPAFRVPDGERCWLFGLLRAASPEDVPRLQAENVRLYERGRQVGALRYPCDSLQLPDDEEGWRRHYGDTWPQVCRVRDEIDPERRLRQNRWLDPVPKGA